MYTELIEQEAKRLAGYLHGRFDSSCEGMLEYYDLVQEGAVFVLAHKEELEEQDETLVRRAIHNRLVCILRKEYSRTGGSVASSIATKNNLKQLIIEHLFNHTTLGAVLDPTVPLTPDMQRVLEIHLECKASRSEMLKLSGIPQRRFYAAKEKIKELITQL